MGLYPNIVFVLVDDQGGMLGETDHMPKLKVNVVDGMLLTYRVCTFDYYGR